MEPAADGHSDEELMAAYAAGDPAAFDVLFERYGRMLYRVMRRQLPTDDDAHDLVQQTFLHLHRARRDFRGDARFRPWLFTIALNLRREHWRRLGRRPEVPLDLDLGEPASTRPGAGASHAGAVVHQALGRLPAAQAEVIRLHWLEGFSFPEIAAMVGAGVSAVKVRAHRGYKAMREALAAAGGNRAGASGISSPEEP